MGPTTLSRRSGSHDHGALGRCIVGEDVAEIASDVLDGLEGQLDRRVGNSEQGHRLDRSDRLRR